MREELDALIGVGWGESSPKRQGYRNGYYSRDLLTSTGRIEDLRVPHLGQIRGRQRAIEALRRKKQVARDLAFFSAVWLYNNRYGIQRGVKWNSW